MPMVDSPARRMWALYEPYHGVTYFSQESRAATDAVGCTGGWMGYFAARSAPLGAASPELVTATFYNFSPRRVAKAVPAAWGLADPERFLQARLAGVDAALTRMLGADVVAGVEVAEAAELASEAAGHAPLVGRPLAAANAALPWPSAPHLVLWQATTVLRESRGDGHVAALVSAGLDGVEALVAFAADTGVAGPEQWQLWRGWSGQEWAAAVDRLSERGLLNATGSLTERGVALRQWVEERTDASAAAPWTALGERRTERLAELLTPLLRTLIGAGAVVQPHPMGITPTT